ncbi:MAG: RtcB family protein [Candidatus Nealsonbacteria bacterium]|nr:RtcB family protein [Candidatus Nealsonbacteria bacterium]
MAIILDEKNISPEVKRRVNEISNLPGVKEVVAFPDIHLKSKYANLGYRIDIPSSLAILTEDCLYPQFRSRGLNCGMALLKTNLFYEDALLPKLEKVLLNFNKGLVRNLFNYFRFPLQDKFSLSTEEFQRICRKDISQFNYSGIRKEWRQGTLRLKRKMGKHFGGNHFMEFQAVDDVFNEEQAKEWGIRKGQICLLYHTAGESLDDILEEDILKETIYQPKFVKLDKSSPNFPIILKALKMLMNYGFAYRLTTFSILKDLFAEVFGGETELEHFSDHYHNGIEEIKKDPDHTLFLYRHNVNKVSSGSPVILSGSFNLKSYVNKGAAGAENFLWSADHGYGDLTRRFPQEKIDSAKVKRLLFKKGVNLPFFVKTKKVDLEYNSAAPYLLSLLEEKNISKKVFSLAPIINLKFI